MRVFVCVLTRSAKRFVCAWDSSTVGPPKTAHTGLDGIHFFSFYVSPLGWCVLLDVGALKFNPRQCRKLIPPNYLMQSKWKVSHGLGLTKVFISSLHCPNANHFSLAGNTLPTTLCPRCQAVLPAECFIISAQTDLNLSLPSSAPSCDPLGLTSVTSPRDRRDKEDGANGFVTSLNHGMAIGSWLVFM